MQNMAIIYNFCLHSGKDICNRETKCPIQLCLHEDNNNFNN